MTERVRRQLCRLWDLLLPGLIALCPMAGPLGAATPGTLRTTSEDWRDEVAPSYRMPRGLSGQMIAMESSSADLRHSTSSLLGGSAQQSRSL